MLPIIVKSVIMNKRVQMLAVTFGLCLNFNSCLTGQSNKLMLGSHSVVTFASITVSITQCIILITIV